jgi:hypothetical protein
MTALDPLTAEAKQMVVDGQMTSLIVEPPTDLPTHPDDGAL